MMRHQYSLSLGLATLFVLPGTLPGGQEPATLEQRLEATIEALERLAGIDRRVHAGEGSALLDLLRRTEPALPDPVRRDATLTLLRTQVASLQQRWDEISTSGSPLSTLSPGTKLLPTQAAGASLDGGAPEHTGLDLSAYAGIGARTERHGVTSLSGSTRVGGNLHSFEDSEEFTADARRMGRLLARTKRWDEALVLLLPYRSEPDAQYWLARCYEGQDRRGEAVELLQGLISAGEPDSETGAEAQPEARSLARRASYDLRFLELRRDLKLKTKKERRQ